VNRSKIEWTDMVWNPITGCTRGCSYCYARRMAYRLKGRYGYPEDHPFKPTFHGERLSEPYDIKNPKKIFVCSMGELFDPLIDEFDTSSVLAVMADNPQHTFQLLTKQVGVLKQWSFGDIPNLWVGISEDATEPYYNDRIDILRKSDAHVKFISFEPLLSPIAPDIKGIDWVIIGAETGPGARPLDLGWAEIIIDIARTNQVSVFLKDNLNWPEKIQEFPEVLA
jgi:protein gp37